MLTAAPHAAAPVLAPARSEARAGAGVGLPEVAAVFLALCLAYGTGWLLAHAMFSPLASHASVTR